MSNDFLKQAEEFVENQILIIIKNYKPTSTDNICDLYYSCTGTLLNIKILKKIIKTLSKAKRIKYIMGKGYYVSN